MPAVDTLNYIKKAPRVRFAGPRWSAISNAAKECIKAMLEPDTGTTAYAAQLRPVCHSTCPPPDVGCFA